LKYLDCGNNPITYPPPEVFTEASESPDRIAYIREWMSLNPHQSFTKSANKQ
jgi:hypothetical protein